MVEPVFGQIKQARGFRQFLLRGVEKVLAEWAMICTTHNLLKLFTLANAASAGSPQQMPERLSGRKGFTVSERQVDRVTRTSAQLDAELRDLARTQRPVLLSWNGWERTRLAVIQGGDR